MLEYIIQIIIWTVAFYGCFEIIKYLICKFFISPEIIKRLKEFEYMNNEKYIKTKTKSEIKETK